MTLLHVRITLLLSYIHIDSDTLEVKIFTDSFSRFVAIKSAIHNYIASAFLTTLCNNVYIDIFQFNKRNQ